MEDGEALAAQGIAIVALVGDEVEEPKHRAAEFRRRCRLASVSGKTLHSFAMLGRTTSVIRA